MNFQLLKTAWTSSSILAKVVFGVSVLALFAVLSGAVLWVQGSYYQARQKVRDANTQKELGKLKIENDKLSKENSLLKEEIKVAQIAIDSKAKNADERAKEILKESQEIRERINEQYEYDKQQLEKMQNADDCTRCNYICSLYKRNNLQCPTSCDAECGR